MKSILLIFLFLFFFISRSQTYSETAAKRFWHYNKVSYCDGQKINDWSCNHCDQEDIKNMKNTYYFSGLNSGNAWCGYNPDFNEIVLAFQGSNPFDPIDWINNINFNQIKHDGCSNCYIHEGFWNIFQDTDDQMMNCWKYLNNYYWNAKLVVTGYSLGAAQSQLFVAKLALEQNQYVDYPYHFGTPRVGNPAFAKYMNEISPNAYRIIHNRDPFAHSPTQIGTHYYWAHANTEVFYNADMISYNLYQNESSFGANQFWIYNIFDHLYFFGFSQACANNNDVNVNFTLTNPLIIEDFRKQAEEKENYLREQGREDEIEKERAEGGTPFYEQTVI